MLSESLDTALLDKNAKLSQSSNSVAAAPCQSEPVFAEGPLRPPNRILLKIIIKIIKYITRGQLGGTVESASVSDIFDACKTA